jgi:hypothetical protein
VCTLSFARYWNSRLATERQRLIDTFDENDIVCKQYYPASFCSFLTLDLCSEAELQFLSIGFFIVSTVCSILLCNQSDPFHFAVQATCLLGLGP